MHNDAVDRILAKLLPLAVRRNELVRTQREHLKSGVLVLLHVMEYFRRASTTSPILHLPFSTLPYRFSSCTLPFFCQARNVCHHPSPLVVFLGCGPTRVERVGNACRPVVTDRPPRPGRLGLHRAPFYLTSIPATFRAAIC